VIKNIHLYVSWIPLAYIFLRKIISLMKRKNVPDLRNGYMKFDFIYSL